MSSHESVIDKIEQAVAEKEKGGKGAPSGAAPEPVADEGDELLPAAIDVVMETGQASVSMLQRRLKLGYSRAARIVDEMEQRGIVGPFEGSKPRQLLITREKWEEIKMRGGLGAMSSAAMAAQDAAAENPPVGGLRSWNPRRPPVGGRWRWNSRRPPVGGR